MATLRNTGAPDELLRTVSSDGTLAIKALLATRAVAEAARRHGTLPTASAALGRGLMAAVLLAAGTKDGETVQLQLRGDGPIGSLTAISDASGDVRGYVSRPAVHLAPRGDGKLDVGGAVGGGLLSVVRHRPGWRKPYSGIVEIVSGEIAEDVAHYLSESEQVPSAVALGVFVAADGHVAAAAGFCVQALPGASERTLIRLEERLKELPSPSQMARGGWSASQILGQVGGGLELRPAHRSGCRFHCSCDEQRVLRAVTLLGRAETREIARLGEELEVRCEFCARSFRVDPDRVGTLHADG